jgi:hypothetical protein
MKPLSESPTPRGLSNNTKSGASSPLKIRFVFIEFLMTKLFNTQ